MLVLLLLGLVLAAPPRPRLALPAGAETASLARAFLRSCPAVQITTNRRAADYLLAFDPRAWSLHRWKHDRWELARAGGDLVAAGASVTLGRAVKAVCAAIAADRGSAAGGAEHHS
ncbi:MAG TPA: hypothetical protein VE996_13275 [Terriglobales bacterium]|jgi:hypothetical protein|nr:hypothetical protein [Terriglobales bacterium]